MTLARLLSLAYSGTCADVAGTKKELNDIKDFAYIWADYRDFELEDLHICTEIELDDMLDQERARVD